MNIPSPSRRGLGRGAFEFLSLLIIPLIPHLLPLGEGASFMNLFVIRNAMKVPSPSRRGLGRGAFQLTTYFP